MKKVINFIKGHMGGNEIVLLYGDQMADSKEVQIALSISMLDPPNIGGHQAGLLYKSQNKADMRVRIVDVTARDYISMCGGLTQVLGKALMETDLAEDFDMELKEPTGRVTLKTDIGLIPLEIEKSNGKPIGVLTGMKPFVEECYQLGVEPVKLAGVDATRVGKFIVMRTNEIKRVHPNTSFIKMNQMTQQVLKECQEAFDHQGFIERNNADFTLYDLDPETPSNTGRIMFPHRISTGHIEPTCGTGTVAAGIALAESGEIRSDDSELLFESGGDTNSIGGPDLTQLKLTINNGKVTDAYFNHSLVEILAAGKAWT